MNRIQNFNSSPRLIHRPAGGPKPSPQSGSDKASVDLNAVKVDHFSGRFNQLQGELQKADEGGQDLLKGSPGQVKVEKKASRYPGVLPAETVRSTSMTSNEGQVTITDQARNRYGGTSSEEYRLDSKTGVLTVLQGGGETSHRTLEIDTKAGVLLSDSNKVERPLSPIIQEHYRARAERAHELYGIIADNL